MTDAKSPPHTEIDPKGRKPEPSFGADEEGEAPVARKGVTEDPAAWVNVKDEDG